MNKPQVSQLLDMGTKIQLSNMRGRVLKSVLTDAHNGGKIALHTIALEERFKRGFGQNGHWAKMTNPVQRVVSYFGLELI